MNLAELTQTVYDITGRPDRVAETALAIQAATLKAHHSDYYWKDIFEAGIAFSFPEFIQNLDYRALVPRWRSSKYLRKYDNTRALPGKVLDFVVPENVFDDYSIQRSDIYYSAGAYIQINSSTQEQYYLFGCYVHPDVTPLTYTSWIALDHPFCIVFDAAATVFKAIGKDEESAAYRGLVAEQISMLRTSEILGKGY